jgi:putative oxidoreductase
MNSNPIFMLYNTVFEKIARWLSPSFLALTSRLALAVIFFYSGRTKVTGWLTVSENAIALFASEYKLPLLSPALGAHLAAYAEHLFPLLLVLGLCTRGAALALLGMTAVIQIFVYPEAWPTHLSWAALALFLTAHGGGKWSLDNLLGLK